MRQVYTFLQRLHAVMATRNLACMHLFLQHIVLSEIIQKKDIHIHVNSVKLVHVVLTSSSSYKCPASQLGGHSSAMRMEKIINDGENRRCE